MSEREVNVVCESLGASQLFFLLITDTQRGADSASRKANSPPVTFPSVLPSLLFFSRCILEKGANQQQAEERKEHLVIRCTAKKVSNVPITCCFPREVKRMEGKEKYRVVEEEKKEKRRGKSAGTGTSSMPACTYLCVHTHTQILVVPS